MDKYLQRALTYRLEKKATSINNELGHHWGTIKDQAGLVGNVTAGAARALNPLSEINNVKKGAQGAALGAGLGGLTGMGVGGYMGYKGAGTMTDNPWLKGGAAALGALGGGFVGSNVGALGGAGVGYGLGKLKQFQGVNPLKW
jgi:hypothetical protein